MKQLFDSGTITQEEFNQEKARVSRKREGRHDQRLGLDLADKAAVADDAHQELPEAVVELLDVSEDAHLRMVRSSVSGVHAVPNRRPHSTKCGATTDPPIRTKLGICPHPSNTSAKGLRPSRIGRKSTGRHGPH
jgi:Short C-terminal domain